LARSDSAALAAAIQEAAMETKKIVLAIVVTYIIMWVAGFLIHAVWLGPTYESLRSHGVSFRPQQAFAHKLWLIWAGDLLYTIMFVWIYTRGVEDKPWVGQGIRYGILMTLFTVVPSTINDYVVYPLPHTLAVKWMIGGLIALLIMGLATAGICRKSPA
jgi:hypothetical protein